MKIAIGNDHAATQLKDVFLGHLKDRDYVCVDFGVGEGQTADYPDIARDVCKMVSSGAFERGILLCGTGAGMCMAANKIRGIRAVVCSDVYTAQMARTHNDANILCIGARVVGSGLALSIADAFLDGEFEGGRHVGRVDKIMDLESVL